MNRQISPCEHGGGSACQRQGGSGEASHAAGYVHPYPTIQEVGEPAADPVIVKSEDVRTVRIPGLESFFDDDLSKAVLSVNLGTALHARDIVKKSMYDIDLDSDEGVTKLLELLPIMDIEILIDIAGELWPGYPAQDANPKMLRLEIKGYLMDVLDGHGQDEAEEIPEGEEPLEEGEGETSESGEDDPDTSEPTEGTIGAEDPADIGSVDAEPAP